MSARTRLLVDTVLLAAFVAAYYPFKTGLAIHEWLCLIVIIPSLVHLVVNWDWAQRAATKLFGRMRSTTRLNFAVDSALFVAVISAMLSGFLVSRVIGGALGYSASPLLIWHRVHSLSADATIVLALVHLGLHWRWVVRVVRTRVLAGLVDSRGDDDLVLVPADVTRDGWQYTRQVLVAAPPGRTSVPARSQGASVRASVPARGVVAPTRSAAPVGLSVSTRLSTPVRTAAPAAPSLRDARRRERSHDA